MRYYLIVVCLVVLNSCLNQKPDSLIPKKPGTAPDYFCTWNVQGYVASYQPNEKIREGLNEKNIFGTGEYENWVEFYPSIRSDLYFVMDDSWDIPKNVNSKDNEYLGTVELDTGRFPSYKGLPDERLKKLTDDIEARGWKGVGGWICAQEALVEKNIDQKAYWVKRLKDADTAGFDYWKVDWGKQSGNKDWRLMLSQLGSQNAPNLIIEHALKNEFIEFSDVFRTYDVENIIAQPVTIQRVANLLKFKTINRDKGIINCEDEPYIAAGLGCAIGIMRHPFNGNLPNGIQDFVFPPVGRDIKNKLDEVIRGVRWHRIADPFGTGTCFYEIDSVDLKDYWILEENETWMKSRQLGDTILGSAPARISRGLPLPEITNLYSENQPFVLASRYPNGVISVVTIGRSLGHEYILKQETVTLQIPDIYVPIGVFGDYKNLILEFPQNLETKQLTIYGQDLAGETPVDITDMVQIRNNKMNIPGSLIRKIGLMLATKNDSSAPGMVMKIIRK